MKRLWLVFTLAFAFVASGCTAPSSFTGYVHAECDPTDANDVTVCRSTQMPVPTVTQTVTASPDSSPAPDPAPTTAAGPANLRLDPATTVTASSFRVVWDAVAGVAGTSGYRVYKNDSFHDTSSDTGETIDGLTAGSTTKIGVSAVVNGVETQITSADFSTTTGAPVASAVPAPGNWTQVFGDEFNGSAVDTTKWRTNWYAEGGVMNKVGTYSRNATVANGELRLVLESGTAGGLIHTDFSGGYKFPVGSYVEARVYFPSSADGQNLYNWPAWWVSSTVADGWPSSGEHDIAEVLGMSGQGKLTVNYHSPTGAHNQGTVAGTWGNSWHTYGIHRQGNSADVYWDGVKVKSYTTSDNGNPEILIFNMGKSDSRGLNTGLANAMRVDYVRAYAPAP